MLLCFMVECYRLFILSSGKGVIQRAMLNISFWHISEPEAAEINARKQALEFCVLVNTQTARYCCS